MLSDGFLEESGVSGFEKLLVSRSNLDNSMLTKADVAAMYGESESAVSMVTTVIKSILFMRPYNRDLRME